MNSQSIVRLDLALGFTGLASGALFLCDTTLNKRPESYDHALFWLLFALYCFNDSKHVARANGLTFWGHRAREPIPAEDP
jgi:hypothetical protein